MIVSSSTKPGRERLPDHVGPAHDVDVLPAGRLPGPLDRLLDAGDERERAALGLLLGPVGHDEERQPPRVLVAPVLGRLVRPAAADHRTEARHRLREPGRVLARRLARRLGVVRPRPAEHPVVQPLAALAETLARARRRGPATYPSTDVVIAATTLVIRQSPFFRTSCCRQDAIWRPDDFCLPAQSDVDTDDSVEEQP